MVTAKQVTYRQQPEFVYPVTGYTETLIEHVVRLSGLGMQVLPAVYGEKETRVTHSSMRYKRLDWANYPDWLHKIWIGRKNLLIMCGRVSDNLVVVDYDDNKPAFEQAVQAAVAHWGCVFASHTSTGGHLYFKTDYPVKSMDFANGEIRSDGNYVIAPPSYNAEKGTLYRWHESTELTQAVTGVPIMSPPQTTADELVSILGLQNKQRLPLQIVYNGRKKRTTLAGQNERARIAEYLRDGALVPEGQRNPTLLEIAGMALRQGVELESLRLPAAASGLPDSEITGIFNRLRKGFIPSNSTVDYAKDRDRLQSWIAGLPLPIKTAVTDRAVLLALATRYNQDANSEGIFHASIRSIAAAAAKDKKTVIAALNRLIAACVIVRIDSKGTNSSKGIVGTAAQYKFNLQRMAASSTTNALQESVGVVVEASAIQNNPMLQSLHSYYGLRGQAVPVYRYLCQQQQAMSITEIARALGIHRETARNAVYALLKHDLIEAYDKRYSAQYDPHKIQRTLDRLETASKTENRQKRIRQRNDAEQHVFLFEKILMSLRKYDSEHKQATREQYSIQSVSLQPAEQPATQPSQPALQPDDALAILRRQQPQKRTVVTFRNGIIGSEQRE